MSKKRRNDQKDSKEIAELVASSLFDNYLVGEMKYFINEEAPYLGGRITREFARDTLHATINRLLKSLRELR